MQNYTTVVKRNIHHLVDEKGRIRKFQPWLSDLFSFSYDAIMRRSIFPKKFSADMGRHLEILRNELKGFGNARVLELGTGTGSAALFLDPSIRYTGTDVSPGLLKRAVKRFEAEGFEGAELFLTQAEDLPFADRSFDVCVCILSFNFFLNACSVLKEIRRVLTEGGIFLCCIPAPERNQRSRTIRGNLFTEEEWIHLLNEYGFRYERIPDENGALLYFRAVACKKTAIKQSMPQAALELESVSNPGF